MNLNSDPKNTPSTKVYYNQAITLKIIQSFFYFFPSQINDVTHWKQKVAMATS